MVSCRHPGAQFKAARNRVLLLRLQHTARASVPRPNLLSMRRGLQERSVGGGGLRACALINKPSADWSVVASLVLGPGLHVSLDHVSNQYAGTSHRQDRRDNVHRHPPAELVGKCHPRHRFPQGVQFVQKSRVLWRSAQVVALKSSELDRHGFGFAPSPSSTNRRMASGRDSSSLWSEIHSSIGSSSAGGMRTNIGTEFTGGRPMRLFLISEAEGKQPSAQL